MKKNAKLEKMRNVITILVIAITVICCIVPFITKEELSQTSMTSAFGEEITLYGKGLYARNSFSMATQAMAQDMVTLILAVPCTIVALYFVQKRNTLAQFVLTGLLAYTLYTYMSYAFLMYYNELFLLYVADMTLSFYGFVISVNLLMKQEVTEKLQEKMKTKGLRIFLSVTGVVIAFMWGGRIIPTIGNGQAPVGLDNYSTLVIQVLDLGVIVPACFVISYLLKERNKLGYIFGAGDYHQSSNTGYCRARNGIVYVIGGNRGCGSRIRFVWRYLYRCLLFPVSDTKTDSGNKRVLQNRKKYGYIEDSRSYQERKKL